MTTKALFNSWVAPLQSRGLVPQVGANVLRGALAGRAITVQTMVSHVQAGPGGRWVPGWARLIVAKQSDIAVQLWAGAPDEALPAGFSAVAHGDLSVFAWEPQPAQALLADAAAMGVARSLLVSRSDEGRRVLTVWPDEVTLLIRQPALSGEEVLRALDGLIAVAHAADAVPSGPRGYRAASAQQRTAFRRTLAYGCLAIIVVVGLVGALGIFAVILPQLAR